MIVSICVIAYNEEKVLGRLLDNICEQTYPHCKIEVVLVDSASTDNTAQIMRDFCNNYKEYFYDIKVAANLKRKQASGWNIAIGEATGDVVIRVDAHAKIPSDYIEKCSNYINLGEAVVGGARPNISEDNTKWQNMLLTAEESMFGSGMAAFRRETTDKTYVKSVFHGAYKKEVFERTGGFDERLGRTEDNEMHYRIRKAGYKICFAPDIISYQYVRSTLSGMLKQKFGNGYWVGLTLAICPACLSWYHFIPFLFVLALLITAMYAMVISPVLFFMVLGAYLVVNIVMTLLGWNKENRNVFFVFLPIVFLMLHLAYGFGTIVGIIMIPRWFVQIQYK